MGRGELRRALDREVTEKQLQADVRKLARLFGWMDYHAYDSRRSPHGFPDLVLVHPRRGWLVFAELKREEGETTEEQDRWLEALAKVVDEDCTGSRVGVYEWRPSDAKEIEEVLRHGPG